MHKIHFALGAFLVPYLLMLFLCGIPLFFMEMCLGQFSSTGCITMFRIAPLLKGKIIFPFALLHLIFVDFLGTGYAIVVVNIICTIYYNVIIAYPLVFIVKSIAKELPWLHCNNEWNTQFCLELQHSQSNTTEILARNITGSIYKTPADEFFKYVLTLILRKRLSKKKSCIFSATKFWKLPKILDHLMESYGHCCYQIFLYGPSRIYV